MDEIVAGRPIFSFPMRRGGFRLRYGRTRFMGILSKAIHPATMVLLDDFPVFGTQVKTERPAWGGALVLCAALTAPLSSFAFFRFPSRLPFRGLAFLCHES